MESQSRIGHPALEMLLDDDVQADTVPPLSIENQHADSGAVDEALEFLEVAQPEQGNDAVNDGGDDELLQELRDMLEADYSFEDDAETGQPGQSQVGVVAEMAEQPASEAGPAAHEDVPEVQVTKRSLMLMLIQIWIVRQPGVFFQ